ncbi:MAG: 16S rRNA (uracil(1498)-N(3))-methyltransferase [Candidatus Adiutrix sp.]|nr:16S rRNA (uracil(1498)-N(3))-methyltransferase [Candidatus Adiutrix sp.]
MRVPRLAWNGEPAGQPGGPVELRLEAAQARHGVTVLRLKPGDPVEVAGPAGLARARVTVAQDRPPRLVVVLEEGWRPRPEEPAGPRLALALINWPRFDWAVEKAAELGAGELWPLVCGRIKPGLARAASARAERWRRLAEAARKQCGRPRPLIVRPPVTPAELLAAAGPGPAGLFLSPAAPAAPGLAVLGPENRPPGLWLLVGPEGGFSPEEEAAFLAAGLRPWRLGPFTLRAETAALAALALVEKT